MERSNKSREDCKWRTVFVTVGTTTFDKLIETVLRPEVIKVVFQLLSVVKSHYPLLNLPVQILGTQLERLSKVNNSSWKKLVVI